MSTWKRDFASGLIVLGPIIATLFICYLLYSFISNLTPGVVINADLLEPFLPGIGDSARAQIARLLRVITFLTFLAVLMIAFGPFLRTKLGALFEDLIDYGANRVPGLRLVYNASKTATETTIGENESLQTPVKLETWKGFRMTAFKTGQTTEDDRVLLFLPTSPNITTGFVLEVDHDHITTIDETVEEALTRVVSAGFGDADRAKTDLEKGTEITVIDEMAIDRKDE
ncbi:DUF502 domain-containing protein [Halostagnicola bangensis]